MARELVVQGRRYCGCPKCKAALAAANMIETDDEDETVEDSEVNEEIDDHVDEDVIVNHRQQPLGKPAYDWSKPAQEETREVARNNRGPQFVDNKSGQQPLGKPAYNW